MNGLPDSPKTEAKTGRRTSQVCVGTRQWAKFRFIHITLSATDCGLLMQRKNGEASRYSG